ncbi:hypothetical protein CS022_10945 [Veronia nyctiphanis]|uniref:Uncharacterized protein n=1 Tax=Veronia nyctiphanis TaxID=1278244 RepID=A0A4Q0YRH9_9GAMM|nr:hypothetical protein [Veronia nyctiphanis]RXJ73245.1 hypothetical protein CS022_10945 [Veronia nyctiphanis]
MKNILTTLFIVFFSVGSLADIFDDIESAVNKMNIGALEQFNEGKTYRAAYAHYRLAFLYNFLGEKKKAKRPLENVISLLDGKDDSESLILKASAHGLQIGLSPIKAVFLGSKIDDALEAAAQKTPDNPRLLMTKAVNAFNTPSLFGGNNERALSLINKAENAFALPCDQVCWGKAENQIWKALILQEMKGQDAYIAALEASLRIDPENIWARQLIDAAK